MALALACIIWVFLATGTAFLPMRYQMVPGFLLLTSAFVLIWWVGRDVSPWAALAALAGFVSMFRRPLWFLGRRALGLPVERPEGSRWNR